MESNDWETKHQLHKMRGELECNCGSVAENQIKATDYFPQDRTSRLPSEVLASICKMAQIDRIPQSLLEELAALSSDEDNGDIGSSKRKENAGDSPHQASRDISPAATLDNTVSAVRAGKTTINFPPSILMVSDHFTSTLSSLSLSASANFEAGINLTSCCSY